MARPKKDTTAQRTVWDAGEANPKQLEFYKARTPFVAYGGAKGGGKTHAIRTNPGWSSA